MKHQNNQNNTTLNLQDLHLLHLINYHQSITAAAHAIELSQSALSRKLQIIEQELGIQLFNRTTRRLSITPAGKQLLRDTAAIPNILNSALQRMSEDFLGTQKRINIGISADLSLAHLPGIFHQQSRQRSDVRTIISQPTAKEIIKQVSTNELDIGILTHTENLEHTSVIHHQMDDRFCLILSAEATAPSMKPQHFKRWASQQSWILPTRVSSTRQVLDNWLTDQAIHCSPAMELDNFDIMCQLVALNMGTALIPKRALTSFPRRKQLQHLNFKYTPIRKLCVIGPKNTVVPQHISKFIDSILFS